MSSINPRKFLDIPVDTDGPPWYDQDMHIEWDYREPIAINGEVLESFRPPDHHGEPDFTRRMHVAPRQGLFLKVDTWYTQGRIEQTTWDALAPEDRPYFVPILASGDVPDSRSGSWCVQPYWLAMEDSEDTASRVARQLAWDLSRKYDVSDFDGRQWKVLPDWPDHPLIHDYGFSHSRLTVASEGV